jgi:hypothetical protein
MKLYYMETMNPRKVCATAKYLRSPIEYIPIDRVPGGLKGAEYMAQRSRARARRWGAEALGERGDHDAPRHPGEG